MRRQASRQGHRYRVENAAVDQGTTVLLHYGEDARNGDRGQQRLPDRPLAQRQQFGRFQVHGGYGEWDRELLE
jgi:hypothetical protein